jgi:hypothetical protein
MEENGSPSWDISLNLEGREYNSQKDEKKDTLDMVIGEIFVLNTHHISANIQIVAFLCCCALKLM